MIFDSFDLPLNQMKYPKVIEETIEYLKGVDFNSLSLGKHQIKGDDVFFNFAEYETSPWDDRIVEAHKEYVDIQFLISGSEKIGYSAYSDKNPIKVEYSKDKDVLIYESVANECEVVLVPGTFAIFFTDEPHRPCCMNKESEKVKKIVVKIKKCCI